ncbi:MAG: DUF1844 domain-containing protein [Pirellulales bacterium]
MASPTDNDPTAGPAAAAAAGGSGVSEEELTRAKLPPASFWTLVEMLASQAMVFLGLHPDPVKKQPVVRLNFARHYIDTLSVLEDKTRGNLTDEEAAFLEHVLHDLRMTFVAVQKKSDQ